jgi:hypothetical protein
MAAMSLKLHRKLNRYVQHELFHHSHAEIMVQPLEAKIETRHLYQR